MPELKDYRVNIENYYGPLDLLLHLVKESEVDITRITLANACRQYIAFLSAMEHLDINLSSDFLALASQLLLIKSRTLAPAEIAPEDEEGVPVEEEDASLDLIRKLLDYKRFKDRARELDRMATERALRWGRPYMPLPGETDHEPMRNLGLWDLVLFYSRVVKSTRLDVALSILYHDVPIEIFVEKIIKALGEKDAAAFSELVGDLRDRGQVIGTFLAILELAKEQRVRVVQEFDMAEINVTAAPQRMAS